AAAMSRSGVAPRVWVQSSIVKLRRSTWGELLLTFPTLTKQVPERNAGPRRRAPARGAAYRPENCVKPLRRSDYRHWAVLAGGPARCPRRGRGISALARQVPGAHPADDPGGIGHDDHVVTESGEGARADPAGVAASKVQPVPQVHRAQVVDDGAHPARPVGIPQPDALVLAQVVVVGEPPPDRGLGELLMRSEPPAVKKRVPESGAEREDELQTAARDRPRAVHLGVIEHH